MTKRRTRPRVCQRNWAKYQLHQALGILCSAEDNLEVSEREKVSIMMAKEHLRDVIDNWNERKEEP